MRSGGWLNPALVKFLALSAVVGIIGACGGGGAIGTPATSTSSSISSFTPAPTQTLTPEPTITSMPTAVPTPAAVGAAVPYGSLEITVLKTATHDLIVPGGLYYYYPTDRTKFFLDLGVLVRNQDPGHPVSVQWKNVAITEADGKSLSPGFADTKTLEPGSKYDPFRVGISTQASDTGTVQFEKDTYLRLIYVVARNQAILFGIEDSPKISLAVGK